MKTYCRSCGEGIVYGMKRPICCPFCSVSLSVGVDYSKINTNTSVVTSTPLVKIEPSRSKINKIKVNDENDDNDSESIDIQSIINKANVSDWFGVTINKPRAETIDNLAKNDKSAIASNKIGPKLEDIPAQQILEEFRQEAGTRKKSDKVTEIGE